MATARQHSVLVLLVFAAIFGFRLYSTDVTQGYLQSAEEIMRDVYIKPTGEFELGPGQLLKLLKPLYGLADGEDYRRKKMFDNLKEELGMQTQTTDGAFFFKLVDDKLSGMGVTYVDDSLQA